MRSFKLSARRVSDLAAVLNAATPAEIAKMTGKEEMLKNNKMAEKLVEELQTACGSYAELMDKVTAKQQELTKSYQEKIDAINEPDMAKKEKLAAPIVAEANAENAKLLKKLDEELHYVEAGKAEVTVEIKSDERFVFLKECLAEIGKKYNQRKPFVETVEAVESAKEV